MMHGKCFLKALKDTLQPILLKLSIVQHPTQKIRVATNFKDKTNLKHLKQDLSCNRLQTMRN